MHRGPKRNRHQNSAAFTNIPINSPGNISAGDLLLEPAQPARLLPPDLYLLNKKEIRL